MKQKYFLAITLVASSFLIKNFSYTISSIDPKTGMAKATLEKSTALIQTKGKTSSTSSTYIISNAKSLIRIRMNDAVFQSSLDNLNSTGGATDYITLYKLTTGKSSRSFTINTDGSVNAALIPLNFISGETRTYTRINPAQGLTAGEYAFVDKSTMPADGSSVIVWTFGIDN